MQGPKIWMVCDIDISAIFVYITLADNVVKASWTSNRLLTKKQMIT